jgi:hypothetical protein
MFEPDIILDVNAMAKPMILREDSPLYGGKK